MFTPLLICLAILAILIHALYGRADHKPWLYNCLASIVYLWGVVVAYDVFFYAPGHPAGRAQVEQTSTMQSGGKRRLIPTTPPDFDNIDPADIDMTPTCGSCGPKPSAPTAVHKPVAVATNFIWPARGKVISKFDAGRNPGINIQVKNVTDIRAADAGNVIYSNENETDWGRVVMIQHANGYASIYANNSAVTVKKGDVVKQGAVIAKSGMLKGQSTPQLHFRLRRDDAEVDPSLYLKDDVIARVE
jgi:murein DD-endopeptidase MepM/ murein hydrolase activator NlpD